MIIPFPAPDPAQAALGRQLRRVREARGFSLDRLSHATGLSETRLSLAEQGRSRLTAVELHAIIAALHIPLGLLDQSRTDLRGLRPL